MRFRLADWYAVPLALFALVLLLIVLRWRAVVHEEGYEAPFGFSVLARAPEPEASATGNAPGYPHAARPAAPARPAAAADSGKGAGRKPEPAGPPPGGRGPAAAKPAISGPLNLNQATAAELTSLPGVGPVLAGRIVSYRNEHGRFKSVDELDKVKGVGPKMLEKLQSLLYVSTE